MKCLLQEMANRFWAKYCYSGILSIRRCALFAGLLALILVPRSFGQGLTGSISGYERDPNHYDLGCWHLQAYPVGPRSL
jgi:hypothetical protein